MEYRGRTQTGNGSSSQMQYEEIHPTFDWNRDSEAHILLLDLPGFRKEEVRVQLDNFGNITTSGERHISGNTFARFKQVFTVPGDSNFEQISAKFDHGILYIIMPRIRERSPQRHKEMAIDSKITEDKKHEEKDDHHKHHDDHSDDGSEDHTSSHDHSEDSSDEESDGKNSDENDDNTDDEANKNKERESKKTEGSKEKEERRTEKQFENGFVEGILEIINRNKNIIISTIVVLSIGLYVSRNIRPNGE
ncbi:hypothetical protein AMTRI_Chr05g74020 [Amborella trichopoda]